MRKIFMTLALLAALVVSQTPLPAQTARSALSPCDRARADLRVELARAASTRPQGGWGTSAVHSTSNGASITTTQRTLYLRSYAVLDSARSVLDSIRALHADVDEPTIEQTRPRLRARLGEMMDELKREDGPRYEIMEPALKDAAALVMRLGLVLCRAGSVNPDDEASTIARYVRLEHGVALARRDWIAAGAPRRPMVMASVPSVGNGPPMLAAETTNVAAVSDTLDAVTQSLDSLESALDGVLSPEQRDSVKVTAPDATQHSLAQLLTRIERFAAEDAPRVLEGGGAGALPTLSAAADTLRQLVRALRLPAPTAAAAGDAEAGAHGARAAEAALERLALRLDALYRLLGTAGRD
jgi:hypothetical protein